MLKTEQRQVKDLVSAGKVSLRITKKSQGPNISLSKPILTSEKPLFQGLEQ